MNTNFLLAIFSTTLIISGINILIPVLPVHFLNITGNPASMGFLMGAASVSAVVLRPISCFFINKIGIRESMISGAMILSVVTCMYFFMKSFASIFVLRIFFGLAIVLFFVSVWTMIGHIIPEEKRGFALSVYTVSFLAPNFYAQLIGTKLSGFTPFMVSGILMLCAAGLCIFIKGVEVFSVDQYGFFKTLFRRDLFFPGIIIFSVIFADAAATIFLPAIAPGLPMKNYGLFFSVFAVSTISVRLYFGKNYSISNRIKHIITGLVFVLVSFIAIGFSIYLKGLFLLLIAGFLYGTGFALIDPNLFALIMEKRKDFSMAQIMAGYGGFFDLGYAAGPVFMGVMYKNFKASGVYSAAAAVVFLGFLAASYYFKRREYAKI